MDTREVFTQIYQNYVWGKGTNESPLSGDGSLPDNSRPYVDFIKSLISQNQIENVLDFGHGDWAMWRDYDFDDVSYVGVDVADDISTKLSRDRGSTKRRFVQISEDFKVLPVADLVITKEVLQHLSNSETIRILEAFSVFEHIVICNDYFPKKLFPIQVINVIQFKTRMKRLLRGKSFLYHSKIQWNNGDIKTGEHRGIDLERQPFSGLFSNHKLISTFSYSSRRRSGYVAKVYYFKKAREQEI